MTDDLDKLIEAWEAGFPEWGLLEADGLIDGENADHLRDAYHGDLNAAKALHDALIPGWERESGYIRVYSDGHSSQFVRVADGNPARAWGLAVLKAYRAEQS